MTRENQSAEETTENQRQASSGAAASASAEAGGSAAASAASASGEHGGSEQVRALEAEVEKLSEALKEATEASLRAQAEAQNTRRRAEQDVEKAHKYALERFVGDMLPVADNLERAIAAANEAEGEFSAVIEGVELTLKSLLDGLKRHNVVQINPVNEPFDPQLHQAMTAVENGEVEPNTVLDVFQKGYSLNGRLVRPAMVVVAKAPAN